MEDEKKKMILESLVLNGQATRLELEGIDPDFETVLVELNEEAPLTIEGFKSPQGEIYYTYTPGGKPKPGIKVVESEEGAAETSDRSATDSSHSPEGSPGGEIPGSEEEDKLTVDPPPSQSAPADVPGMRRKVLEEAKTADGILAYRILVKNFRLSTSGGRTKITAAPFDTAQSAIALEFCEGAPTKGDDMVFIDVWRPEPDDAKKILGTTAEKTDQGSPARSTEVPAKEAPETDTGTGPQETIEPTEETIPPVEDTEQAETGKTAQAGFVPIKPDILGGRFTPAQLREALELLESQGLDKPEKPAAQLNEELEKQGLPADILAASKDMMREEPIS